jgi:FixJ family two-component response regulator
MEVITVVDDEVSVCKAVVRVLQAVGLAARWFSSGDEFLGSWHFDRPACLLLDLHMPVLSGQEVWQALDLAGADFPIIIMTAHDAPSMRDECMRAGAVDYLCKPMDARTLVNSVELAIAWSLTDQSQRGAYNSTRFIPLCTAMQRDKPGPSITLMQPRCVRTEGA